MISPVPEYRPIRTARDAEENAAACLRHAGYLDAVVTPVGPDAGVDVRGTGIIGQVKAEAKPVGRTVVQQTYGCAVAEQAAAVVFALAGFSASAANWADTHGIALFTFDFLGVPEAANDAARRMLANGDRKKVDDIAAAMAASRAARARRPEKLAADAALALPLPAALRWEALTARPGFEHGHDIPWLHLHAEWGRGLGVYCAMLWTRGAAQVARVHGEELNDRLVEAVFAKRAVAGTTPVVDWDPETGDEDGFDWPAGSADKVLIIDDAHRLRPDTAAAVVSWAHRDGAARRTRVLSFSPPGANLRTFEELVSDPEPDSFVQLLRCDDGRDLSRTEIVGRWVSVIDFPDDDFDLEEWLVTDALAGVTHDWRRAEEIRGWLRVIAARYVASPPEDWYCSTFLEIDVELVMKWLAAGRCPRYVSTAAASPEPRPAVGDLAGVASSLEIVPREAPAVWPGPELVPLADAGPAVSLPAPVLTVPSSGGGTGRRWPRWFAARR